MKSLLLTFAFLMSFLGMYPQSDYEQIKMQREASNSAFKALNFKLSHTYLTDDVLITTGSGSHIKNKQELLDYLGDTSKLTVYFIRKTKEIIVNETLGLAWEQGTWKGHDSRNNNKITNSGNYSAMWTKVSGTWLIKSQLFVTLN